MLAQVSHDDSKEKAVRTVEANSSYPTSPEKVWEFLGNPTRWSDWLVIHKSWKSDVPEPATEGEKATATATVINMPITIDWTFEKVAPPQRIELSGITRAGVKLALTITLSGTDDSTNVDFVASVDGGMIDGPMGSMFKKSLTGALTKSLRKLGESVEA
ncbi:SRPBCC family protein [Smaragdicoccus niigatensis]